jgi:hypothetical protein
MEDGKKGGWVGERTMTSLTFKMLQHRSTFQILCFLRVSQYLQKLVSSVFNRVNQGRRTHFMVVRGSVFYFR